MTEQLWTITASADGAILKDCFCTSGADVHPKDEGWAWVEGEHAATPIAARPNLLLDEWTGTEWVASAQIARDRRWDAAKAYCIQRQTAPLPLANIVPENIVVAQRTADGQAWIDRYSIAAVGAVATGVPLEITLTDGLNNRIPLNAAQILALGQASLTQQSLCHNASQEIRAALDAALAAGATAEQIEAIDITTGYPS